MDDDAIRAAVEAADTYTAAAIALGMPYNKLYVAAHRLRVKPLLAIAKEARRRPEPAPAPPLLPVLRQPAPEPTPPRLSPWIPMPESIASKSSVVAVRIDQEGRVRAEVSDLRDGWCCWAVRDITGKVVGKLGMVGGQVSTEARTKAERDADVRLVDLGWLPSDHAVPREPCAMVAPMCSRNRPPVVEDPLVVLANKLLGARRAERGDIGVELARAILERAAEVRADTRA